jgi:RAB protein geranylgeranyltransferase component A
VQDILLYAIVQSPQPVSASTQLPGSEALAAITVYTSQVGTYTAGQAPFIETFYSGAEILQGCCRLCCVKGGMTAL